MAGERSFVPNLLPEQALELSAQDTLEILRLRLGEGLAMALEHADPGTVLSPAPAAIRSPVFGLPDGTWLQQTNLVGINVRTVGTFWNVIKYALTLPKVQDSIHLLPIWEPGVVGSLYGISSWQINAEFFSPELASACPDLDSVERQLKAIINLLHAMGKTVGMDVIPHTDRFSEIVLAQSCTTLSGCSAKASRSSTTGPICTARSQERIMDFLEPKDRPSPGNTFPASARGPLLGGVSGGEDAAASSLVCPRTAKAAPNGAANWSGTCTPTAMNRYRRPWRLPTVGYEWIQTPATSTARAGSGTTI